MRKCLYCFLCLATCFAFRAYGQQAELFDKLDVNKDGFVTSDEVPDDKQAIFERLLRVGDANSDKKLTKDELAAGLKQSAQPEAAPAARAPGVPPAGLQNVSPKEIFARLDRDGNGKIEKEEIPERMKENLGRVDSNSDGSVDLAEFEKVAQFFGGRRPEGAPGNAPGARIGQGELFSPVLRALDSDADGELSASEISDASKALAKLDKNGDGKLTRDEIAPPPGPRADARPGQPAPDARPGAGAFAEQFLKRLQEADANGDKKISKDEAPDRLKENFDRIDRNSDGQLDEAELKAMIERMRERGGRGMGP